MDIFDNPEGWIITKNEKGKTKLATCSDHSVDYDKTREWQVVEADETRTDTLKDPVCERERVVTFFIGDLLRSELKNGMFQFKNLRFVNVFICGTVVSLSLRKSYYHIKVDDGTSCITCLIKPEALKERKTINQIPPFILDDKENHVMNKAVLMMISSKNKINKKIPDFDDIKLGEILKVIGVLKEYNGNRYVFIDKITKEPEQTLAHQQHLEELLHLYEEVY